MAAAAAAAAAAADFFGAAADEDANADANADADADFVGAAAAFSAFFGAFFASVFFGAGFTFAAAFFAGFAATRAPRAAGAFFTTAFTIMEKDYRSGRYAWLVPRMKPLNISRCGAAAPPTFCGSHRRQKRAQGQKGPRNSPP